MNDASQELIRAVSDAKSPAQLAVAVKNLAAANDEAGISTLIAVLGYNNPTPAAIAVAGLTRLGSAVVQPLIQQLDQYDYGARAYGIRVLAAIADPRALDVLLTAAAYDFAPGVRRAAAKGLGTLDWSLIEIESRHTAQTQASQTLLKISQDAEWSIRYAAIVGLQGLLATAESQQIRVQLEQIAQADAEVAVRARAQLALQATPVTATSM